MFGDELFFTKSIDFEFHSAIMLGCEQISSAANNVLGFARFGAELRKDYENPNECKK